MHDFSGMADAGGMGYPPSPLIGPWPRVFGCGAGVFKHQPFALLVCSIQGPRAIISLSDARLAYLIKGAKMLRTKHLKMAVTYTPVAAGPWMRIATADGSGVDGVSVTRW